MFYPLAVDAARDARLPEASALVPTGLTGTLLSVVFFFVIMPLTALLSIYVSAALYQLLVRLIVGRENGGYDATVRVVAYLSALTLLFWVPVLWVPVGLWGVWVGAMGFREVHSTTTARAVLVAGIPYVLWTAWWVLPVVTGEATLADVLLAY